MHISAISQSELQNISRYHESMQIYSCHNEWLITDCLNHVGVLKQFILWINGKSELAECGSLFASFCQTERSFEDSFIAAVEVGCSESSSWCWHQCVFSKTPLAHENLSIQMIPDFVLFCQIRGVKHIKLWLLAGVSLQIMQHSRFNFFHNWPSFEVE